MKYDKIKEYKLSHQQIARMFGYKNVNSFRSSSAHQRIMKGIDEVLKHIDKNSLPTFVLLKEDIDIKVSLVKDSINPNYKTLNKN